MNLTGTAVAGVVKPLSDPTSSLRSLIKGKANLKRTVNGRFNSEIHLEIIQIMFIFNEQAHQKTK